MGPREQGKQKCEDQTGIQVCSVLGTWAQAGMRPRSEESPASTEGGSMGGRVELLSAPRRSLGGVPGTSFQAQHEESSQTDESAESVGVEVGGTVPQSG